MQEMILSASGLPHPTHSLLLLYPLEACTCRKWHKRDLKPNRFKLPCTKVSTCCVDVTWGHYLCTVRLSCHRHINIYGGISSLELVFPTFNRSPSNKRENKEVKIKAIQRPIILLIGVITVLLQGCCCLNNSLIAWNNLFELGFFPYSG